MSDTERRSAVKARKKDALALAELVYDMYKEKKVGAKIQNGQNNAQHSNS